jgi:PAT family beta-lactamase induction signal transducer AmpG
MNKKINSPWAWVPSLYFAEGMPYIIVMTVSVIMYKRLGISNTDIALYTSWLYLPWVIKPVWSPFVDIIKTKRWWIIWMQLLIGAGFAGVAFTLPLPGFFQYSLAFLWLLAFSSATHDIAADGFYMLGLNEHQQTWFVGFRSTFYRIAMISGQGLLVIIAGHLENSGGLDPVEIRVTVHAEKENSYFFHPNSMVSDIGFAEEEGDDVQLVYYPENLLIGQQNHELMRTDTLLDFAQSWNAKHNFTPAKEIINSTGSNNFGFLYLFLSNKPQSNDEYKLTFKKEVGAQNISVVVGEEITFNENNWNVPAMVVFEGPLLENDMVWAKYSVTSGNIPMAWSVTFLILAFMFLLFFLYHNYILPRPNIDKPQIFQDGILKEFWQTWILFFKKEGIISILAFLLLYRFAEAQLIKLASPFLLDPADAGGLNLSTSEVGFVYGTIGLVFLTAGGLLGGFLSARNGLKYWIWPMAIAINLPDIVYVLLAYFQTSNLWLINAAVAVEQFGYGFGFTAYMLFMIYISEGNHKTAHFAISTAFMALGMMIPGMFSGWLQELLGYQNFFLWIMLATIPAMLVVKFVKIDPRFGRNED